MKCNLVIVPKNCPRKMTNCCNCWDFEKITNIDMKTLTCNCSCLQEAEKTFFVKVRKKESGRSATLVIHAIDEEQALRKANNDMLPFSMNCDGDFIGYDFEIVKEVEE